MLVNKNWRTATLDFRAYLNICLRGVYSNTKVKVKIDTIKYAMIDDADYATVYEIMEFEMGDGRRWEIYFEHKGRKYFTQK